MTYEYTPEERALSREIRSLQRDRAYHLTKAADKEREISLLRQLLRDKLTARGLFKKSRTLI